jgi:predicted nucleic acid-binding protein
MPFFIDTSALFKRYQIEKGTDKVCDLIENSREKIFLSSLTVVEVISNLKRLYEIDHLTTDRDFVQQRLFFYNDIERFEMTLHRAARRPPDYQSGSMKYNLPLLHLHHG